jgi:hypothetical protein
VSREFRALARELRPVYRRSRPAFVAVLEWVLRYLPELFAAYVVWRLWSTCSNAIGPLWTLLGWSLITAGAVWWRRSRRWILTAAGCVLTRHRLRTTLIALRLTTWSGRLPLVVWMAPTPVGERVWLWCRAGISAEDIADEIDGLRAACCARDVRVTRDDRWGALVVIDVIRRDPLSATTPIVSPLARPTRQARPEAGRG